MKGIKDMQAVLLKKGYGFVWINAKGQWLFHETEGYTKYSCEEALKMTDKTAKDEKVEEVVEVEEDKAEESETPSEPKKRGRKAKA